MYNTSPRALLKEIILVDDLSDRHYLQKPLEEYIRTFPVRVLLTRTIRRVGLIQAKLLGAKFAKAGIILLDCR